MPNSNYLALFIALFAIMVAVLLICLAYIAYKQGDWVRMIFCIIFCLFALFVGFEGLFLDANDNIFCSQCGFGWWRFNSETVDHCPVCKFGVKAFLEDYSYYPSHGASQSTN